MTTPQLAIGIFFGFAGVEVFKVALAMAYDAHKRQAMVRDLQETTDGFIEKMHREVMADREAQAAQKAKRVRKPAPGRSTAHAAAAKRGDDARAKITKPLTKSQERRHAATKKASK